MAHVKDNEVRRAFVSQASRDAARGVLSKLNEPDDPTAIEAAGMAERAHEEAKDEVRRIDAKLTGAKTRGYQNEAAKAILLDEKKRAQSKLEDTRSKLAMARRAASVDDAVETDQCSRLAAFKQKRDAAAVKRALERIRTTCRSGDPEAARQGLNPHNVMPALVEGALANCTLGEMVQAMADVYGRYSGGPEW